MLSDPGSINTTDFVSEEASATTVGLVTIPANRYFSFDIMLSGSQSGIGTATPHVTLNNSTAGSPAAGGSTIVAQLSITGLLGIVASSTGVTEVAGYSGNSGATLDFTNSGTTTCTVNGFLF